MTTPQQPEQAETPDPLLRLVATSAEKLQATIFEDCDKARELITAMCEKGERAFRMSIPVQPDDSDMLLTRVIGYAEYLGANAPADKQQPEQARALHAAREALTRHEGLLVRDCS